MKTSEHIIELATALSKAQSEMTGAKKSSKGHFSNNYSDLASVCAAISEPFANHELSYVQSPEFNDQYIQVVTRIMHSSGQWIEGVVTLPPTKNDAQGYGSAITYGRRYGLQAMAGIPSVDDDGQAAVEHVALPKLQCSNEKLWAAAVESYKAHDTLDKVLEKMTVSIADRAAIISQAKAEQYAEDAASDNATMEQGV